jgi:4-hydroxybenzoate polyprenyltransferase
MFLPLIGLEVGILMMFYEYIFVNLHFNHSEIIPLWTYIMQLFCVHSAYGYDRWLDVTKEDSNNEELIEYINSNSQSVQNTITFSFLSCIAYLSYYEHTRIFIPLYMLSVLYYRDFKIKYPLLKPVFISIMLITSSVIVPSIITESNYNILQDFNAIIPPIANLYSASNYLDVIDYNIDKINNIKTLPVIFGNNTAIATSLVFNLMSSITFINHPNYGHNIGDFVFQAQNIFSGISLLTNKSIDYRSSAKNPKILNTMAKNKNDDNNNTKMNIHFQSVNRNIKSKHFGLAVSRNNFIKFPINIKYTPRLLV